MKGGKVRIAHEHFIDFGKFYPMGLRRDKIGYVGRLTEGKGVKELVIAICALKEQRKVNFLMIGDGELSKFILDAHIEDFELLGWINHEDLPEYYNQMKLLIIPSYTEALPNVMLEAMACGTPVLATTVGAIPDYIKDNETGFLMKDNEPMTIIRNINRALEPDPAGNSRLDRVANNALEMVRKKFTFEAAVESYRKALFD